MSFERRRKSTLKKKNFYLTGQVTPSQVEASDRVRQRVPLVDRHRVGDAVARVEHDARGAPGGVQREHGLDGDVPNLVFSFFGVEIGFFVDVEVQ